MFEYNDPDDYFDVSNHEVDRQDDLEYEVRAPPPSDIWLSTVSRYLTFCYRAERNS